MKIIIDWSNHGNHDKEVVYTTSNNHKNTDASFYKVMSKLYKNKDNQN